MPCVRVPVGGVDSVKQISVLQDLVMCSMSYLEPVGMAVLCVLPCREHQRSRKGEGRACRGCLHADSGSPSPRLSLCSCVRGTSPTGWSAHSVENGVFKCLFRISQNGLSVFFILEQPCHFYTCKLVCGEYVKIDCLKLQEGILGS